MGYIGNGPYQGVLTGGNIQDGTVETTDLADGAVTTVKIADASVTATKLAAGAAVPSQSGQSGKYLTTDGSTASWGTVDLSTKVSKTGDTMTGDLIVNANVGVGTSSPNEALSVNGSVESLRDAAGEGGELIVRAQSGYDYRYMIDNWADQIRVVRQDDADKGNGTVYLSINANGHVSKPFQPSFYVGLDTPSIFYPSNIIFNVANRAGMHNQGNHYNTSTGLFTAPRSGRYWFHVRVIYEGVPNNADMTDAFSWNINGSSNGYSDRRAKYVADYTGTSAFFVDTATIILNLSTNDTVGVKENKNRTVHGNSNYTIFMGHLLA
jgi:hypothetical protein